MKKIASHKVTRSGIALLIALTMLLAPLTGCSSGDNDPASQSGSDSTSSVAELPEGSSSEEDSSSVTQQDLFDRKPVRDSSSSLASEKETEASSSKVTEETSSVTSKPAQSTASKPSSAASKPSTASSSTPQKTSSGASSSSSNKTTSSKGSGTSASSSKSSNRPTNAYDPSQDAEPLEANEVYITATGSKYHSIPNCGNTKHASPIDKDKAISLGYEPCKKCW